jgi:hypothetical protein
VQASSGSARPFVGRADEVSQAFEALEDSAEFQGVLVVGGYESANTTSARALAGDLESRGITVRLVPGTETGRAMPVGALYWPPRCRTAHEPAEMPSAEKVPEQDKDLVPVVG